MDTTASYTSVERLAAAIREHLDADGPWRPHADPDRHAVELTPATRPPGDVVLAAITEDAALDAVLGYARARAAEQGLPLRLVHVWTGHGREAAGVRMRPESLAHADLLLASAAHELGMPAERQILHDTDPGAALRALGDHAALLVVGASPDLHGHTARALVGRTACALALVVPRPPR
ncbi:universal stress protein [Actinoplanes sp. NPDC049802]|uniref:universal stress protein n=1 Tax=Actinoplanes sp. NPDC049802 TaxID=3154742 RepID=UPI0033ED7049